MPVHIKKAIRDKAKASAKANKNDAIIRKWFANNNMSNDSVFDYYIDSCEMGNDPEAMIQFIEEENFEFGNENSYQEED